MSVGQNGARFHWSQERLQAAADVAEDRLTNEQIAQRAGVARSSVDRWREHPEFMARVHKIIAEVEHATRTRAVANKIKRVQRLNDRWERIDRVITERAQASADIGHGAGTGLLARTVKSVSVEGGEQPGERQDVVEWVFDAALLKEERAIAEQAAKELGQWSDKSDIHVSSTTTLDFSALSLEELEYLAAIGRRIGAESLALGPGRGADLP